MQIVQYVFALIVTLGVLVTVHELGHFLVARWSGAKVVRFSIGFGPVAVLAFRSPRHRIRRWPRCRSAATSRFSMNAKARLRAHEARQDVQSPVADLAHRFCARRTGRELPARDRRSIGRCSSPAAPTSFRSSTSPRPKRRRSRQVCAAVKRSFRSMVRRRSRGPKSAWRWRRGSATRGSIIDREPRARARRRDVAPARDRELAARRRRTGTVPFAGHGAHAAADPRNDPRRRPGARGRVAVVGSRHLGGWKADRAMGRLGRRRCARRPARSLTIEFERDGMREQLVLTPSERTGDDGKPTTATSASRR